MLLKLITKISKFLCIISELVRSHDLIAEEVVLMILPQLHSEMANPPEINQKLN